VDHRLVQEHYVGKRSAPALALYLFLVTVSHCRGLSWCSRWGQAPLRKATTPLGLGAMVGTPNPG
jgi:hypothetical protein